MEDLYSNLDNYNEEITIAMLQSENKNLKSKLEEYASTMDKLQQDILQDLDKLTSEYKKLELNYSSLLKTAKAEIERKTQMITNLNLEKDKLVLKSYQNANTFTVHKNRANDKPKMAKNCKEDKDSKDISPLPHIATERNEQACVPSNNTTVSSNIDLRSKLLSISNSVGKHKDRAEKNSDAKENQPKNKTSMSNAPIQNRRKSMSAVRLEIEKFSSDDDDDDIKSAGSSKDLSREKTDKRPVDSYSQMSRQGSRMSETSSLEDRNSGYHEGSDAYKGRRYSRYDDKFDMNRARDKSSHRYKRYSPDRYGKGSRDRHDSSHSSRRLEHNRRRVESPLDDRYHWGKNRESQRSSFGRSHPSHEAEKEHRNQEKYPKKHKIKNNYDELDNKKMKLDPQYRQHDGEWREREFLEKNYVTETFDFSSCESPDYNHPENPVHQIREIKLTATTKLDDPRISNKKYVLKNNEDDGKIALSTAEGRNVEIIPVNKTAWGFKPVSMPEALVQIPQETLHTAMKYTEIEMDREIKNPVTNICMESGEVNDEGLHCFKESINDELHIDKFDDVKPVEKASQKTNSYKIPKLKKTIDEAQTVENTKEVIPLAKPVCEETKSTDGIRQSNAKSTKEKTSSKKNKQDSFGCLAQNDHNNHELPFLECIDHTQKYTTAKEVVADDLELSDDDISDNSEQPVPVTKDLVDKLSEKKTDQVLNVEQTIKQSTETSEHNVICNKSDNKMKEETRKRVPSVEPSKGKQSKNKKKQKETKAECKDFLQVSEKTTNKMVNEKDTKAGCMQVSEKTTQVKEKGKKKTKQVKSKFTELFDDTCSLISPEDLGLAAAPTSTQLPDSVFALEDAQDAADLNVIEIAHQSESSENTNIGTAKNYGENIHEPQNKQGIDIAEPEAGYTISHETVVKTSEMHPIMNEEPIDSIYKNLEPETLEQGKDFVKTVIISSGVQPPIIESERQVSATEAEPQIVTANKEVPIKALATSTPYKMWQSNEEQAVMEAKPPDTISNSNDGRMAIVGNTQTDNSDANTLASQSNCTDAPDVRIFVRRRRKVVKK